MGSQPYANKISGCGTVQVKGQAPKSWREATSICFNICPGRRGVFDGVMKSLHQHWKHREIAKVITMQKIFFRVVYTVKSLEAESNVVLISIEKNQEGHVILIYRGKNYERPSSKLMGHNLLTKRKALQRSVVMQRLDSLKFFAYQRERAIE